MTGVSNRRTAIITGGSRGLGEALVKVFLDEDFHVATCSRSKTEFVTQTLQDEKFAPRFRWAQLNIAADDTNEFVRAVWNETGRIDVLINNTGVGDDGVLATMKDADIDKVISCNLTGTLKMTKSVVKRMIRQNFGSIVSISSINALRGHSGLSAYSASKAGLDRMTRSLCRELGQKNIRINTVAPGYFESEMVADLEEDAKRRITRRTPLGRLGTAGEVAAVTKFLAIDATFVTGQCLAIDGGFTS